MVRRFSFGNYTSLIYTDSSLQKRPFCNQRICYIDDEVRFMIRLRYTIVGEIEGNHQFF